MLEARVDAWDVFRGIMRKGLVVVCGLAATALGVVGCQTTPSEQAGVNRPTGFDSQEGASRLYESLDQTARDGFEPVRVAVPKGTRVLVYHLYCRHSDGQIVAELSGLNGAGSRCSTRGTSGHVLIDEGSSAPARGGRYSLTVEAPRGAVWSIALDAKKQPPQHL